MLIRRSYRVMRATHGDLRLPHHPVNTLWHTRLALRERSAVAFVGGCAPDASRNIINAGNACRALAIMVFRCSLAGSLINTFLIGTIDELPFLRIDWRSGALRGFGLHPHRCARASRRHPKCQRHLRRHLGADDDPIRHRACRRPDVEDGHSAPLPVTRGVSRHPRFASRWWRGGDAPIFRV